MIKFKRVNTADGKMRRLQVSEEIRRWAKLQIIEDSRPYGQKARIQDVWLHLIAEGLKVKKKLVFRNQYIQTKQSGATNRTQIPIELYKKVDAVRVELEEGKLKRDGEKVDFYNIIMTLIEGGYFKTIK